MPGVHEDIVGEETWMNTDEVSVTDPDPYFFLTQIQPYDLYSCDPEVALDIGLLIMLCLCAIYFLKII